MKINNIKIKNRFRKDLGNLESLKKSIQEIGLLQPIVIDEQNNLIAGYRRLCAFQELRKTDIDVNIVNIINALQGEYDENVIRKSFVPSEAVAIWNAIEKKSGGLGGSSKLSDSDSLRRNKVSKLVGIGHDTLSKAKQVVDYGNKELIEKMDRTDIKHLIKNN